MHNYEVYNIKTVNYKHLQIINGFLDAPQGKQKRSPARSFLGAGGVSGKYRAILTNSLHNHLDCSDVCFKLASSKFISSLLNLIMVFQTYY